MEERPLVNSQRNLSCVSHCSVELHQSPFTSLLPHTLWLILTPVNLSSTSDSTDFLVLYTGRSMRHRNRSKREKFFKVVSVSQDC